MWLIWRIIRVTVRYDKVVVYHTIMQCLELLFQKLFISHMFLLASQRILVVYQNCYSGIIYPLPDKLKWPHILADEIMPSNVYRTSNRPKTCRRREPSEKPCHRRIHSFMYILQRHWAKYKWCPHNLANASKNIRTMVIKLFSCVFIN